MYFDSTIFEKPALLSCLYLEVPIAIILLSGNTIIFFNSSELYSNFVVNFPSVSKVVSKVPLELYLATPKLLDV